MEQHVIECKKLPEEARSEAVQHSKDASHPDSESISIMRSDMIKTRKLLRHTTLGRTLDARVLGSDLEKLIDEKLLRFFAVCSVSFNAAEHWSFLEFGADIVAEYVPPGRYRGVQLLFVHFQVVTLES